MLAAGAGSLALLRLFLDDRERWRFDERVLGSSAFVDGVLATAPPPVPGPRRAQAHVVLEQLCQGVALRCGVGPAEIRLRRAAVAARRLVSHLAVIHYGLSLAATAAALSVSKQSVLRGVAAGARLLAAKGWSVADLLPP
jgi:hypothetical protein